MQDANGGFDRRFLHGGSSGELLGPGIEEEKIAYLLQELDKWFSEGVLTQDAYDGLSTRYKAEHQKIMRQAHESRLLSEARTALAQHRSADALGKAREAIEIDPDNPECMQLLASIYEESGQLAEALSVYESLGSMLPDGNGVQNDLTRVRKALENQRRSQERTAVLASIAELSRVGKIEEAINQCEVFVKDNPNVIDGHVLLASLYYQNKRTEDSIAQMKRALILSPDDPRLKRQLLSYETDLNKLREQELLQRQRKQAEEMRRLRNLKAQELANEAKVNLEKGRLAEALDIAKQSIEYNPAAAETWAIAAQIYSAQGMLKQTEMAWTEALRRDSNNAGYQAELDKASASRAYQERPIWNKLWDKGAQALEAFMEERNVQWIHLLGVAILFAGLIGVSAWVVTVQKLWGIVGRILVTVVPLLMTVAFYHIGCRLRSSLKTTATSLHCIASALLPLDLIMTKHLFPNIITWNWDSHLFAVSLISTLVYISMLAFAQSRVLTALAGIGFLASNLFFMRGFTSFSPASQGLWFSVIGFGYMVVARWVRRKGLSPLAVPIDLLAHVAMAVALGSSIIAGTTADAGKIQASCTILFISLAYALAAYLLDKVRYLPVFGAVFFGFVVFALTLVPYK